MVNMWDEQGRVVCNSKGEPFAFPATQPMLDQTLGPPAKLLNGRGRPLDEAVGTLMQGHINKTQDELILYQDAADLFPDPAWRPFEVMVDKECMTVIGIQNHTLRVLRGQQGTTPAEHEHWAKVRMEPYFIRPRS